MWECRRYEEVVQEMEGSQGYIYIYKVGKQLRDLRD